MRERGYNRRGAWGAALVGAACGAVVALLFWLYLELTSPSAYGRFIALTYGTVLVVFGAVAGLVFGAARDTD